MPTNYTQINAIQQLARAGEVDEALRQLRELILVSDADLKLWQLYAELAVEVEDIRFSLENILLLNPDDAQARARLAAMGVEFTPNPPLIPDYAIHLPIAEDDAGGEKPTVGLSRATMQALGLKDGDVARVHAPDGTPLAVIVQESRKAKSNHLTLNRMAQRMLDVQHGKSLALIPPEHLILLLDTSTSMNNRLKRRMTRIQGTKQAIARLLDTKFGEDNVGLVIFHTVAQLLVRPTQDYNEVRDAVKRMRAFGATAMYEGLGKALNVLRDYHGLKRIILLTDGMPTTTHDRAVLKMAHQAASEQVIIDTIGLGRPGHREYNEQLLRSIAEITGGTFRYVEDLETLQQTFVQLATEKRPLLKG